MPADIGSVSAIPNRNAKGQGACSVGAKTAFCGSQFRPRNRRRFVPVGSRFARVERARRNCPNSELPSSNLDQFFVPPLGAAKKRLGASDLTRGLHGHSCLRVRVGTLGVDSGVHQPLFSHKMLWLNYLQLFQVLRWKNSLAWICFSVKHFANMQPFPELLLVAAGNRRTMCALFYALCPSNSR